VGVNRWFCKVKRALIFLPPAVVSIYRRMILMAAIPVSSGGHSAKIPPRLRLASTA
jgi:hypothetical protein